MKRISVDMDGVLADVYSQFFKKHEEDFGQLLSPQDVAGLPELQAFPNGTRYVTSAGFFRHAPVMPGSQEILQKLNERYDVYIVSAATEFPNSLLEKQAWLNEHFPFITWHQMVFCGSKKIIQADIMIDDHFKNLDHFGGHTILYTQPHNELADAGRHRRVRSWGEIETMLLQEI